MHKISPTILLFLSIFMTVLLSGCGSKGDLYQTPADEVIVSEQSPNDAQNAEEAQPEKLD